MIIQSKQKRTYWVGAILSLIPDIIICIAVSVYFDFGFLEFVLTIIGLEIVYFAIWLKNSLWLWIHFKLRGKKIMADYMENCLKINNFPAPEDFEDSIEEYMKSIAENNELDPIIRIKAGAEIGIFQYIIATQRVQELLTLTIAYEEALLNYKKYLDSSPTAPQTMGTSGL